MELQGWRRGQCNQAETGLRPSHTNVPLGEGGGGVTSECYPGKILMRKVTGEKISLKDPG